jgi:hypothetical protein
MLQALACRLQPAAWLEVNVMREEACPDCDGDGAGDAIDWTATRPWHHEPTWVEVPCSTCGGSGTVESVAFTVRPVEPLSDAPKTQERVNPTEGDTSDEDELSF